MVPAAALTDSESHRYARAPASEERRAKGGTDAWVTGTHAERAKTIALKQLLSATSSGGGRWRCYAEPDTVLAYKRLPRGHAPAFGHGHQLTCSDVGQRFESPVRPANLHPLDSRCRTETDVLPEVVLTQITRSGFHFPDPRPLTSGGPDPCTDRAPIAGRAHQRQ